MIFDDFEAALEEATWCAETEQKIYIVRRKKDKFKVTPKSRMKKYVFHIEVGFKKET
jgi:hypothetical protein